MEGEPGSARPRKEEAKTRSRKPQDWACASRCARTHVAHERTDVARTNDTYVLFF